MKSDRVINSEDENFTNATAQKIIPQHIFSEPFSRWSELKILQAYASKGKLTDPQVKTERSLIIADTLKHLKPQDRSAGRNE